MRLRALLGRWHDTVVRHPWAALAAVAVIAVALGWAGRGLRTDNSLERWFVEGDPALAAYRSFRATFGTDEFVVIAMESDSFLGVEQLQRLESVERSLRAIPGVTGVMGLGTMAREWTDRWSGPPEEGLAVFQETFQAMAPALPLVVPNFIGREGKMTASYVELAPDQPEDRRRIVGAIRREVSSLRDEGLTLYLAGPPLFNVELDQIASRETDRLVPMVVGMIALLLLVYLRSPRYTIFALSVVGVSLLWARGMFVLAGRTQNVVTSTMGPLVLIIALLDAIHILARYRAERRRGLNSADALQVTHQTTLHACFYTSLTTMAGFASLGVSRLGPVRDLGLFTALGIGGAFVAVITLLPALLTLWPGVEKEQVQGTGHNGGFAALGRWSIARPGLILGAGVLMGVVAAGGALQLRVEANTLKFFPDSHRLVVAYRAIQDRLTGLAPLDLVVRSAVANTPLETAQWRALDQLARRLESDPDVTNTISLLDFLNLRQRGGSSPSAKNQSALTLDNVQQRLGELRNGWREASRRYWSADGTAARLTARVRLIDSGRYRQLTDEVNRFADKALGGAVRVEATGLVSLLVDRDIYLLQSLSRSLLLASGVITLLLAASFRSISAALISLIPNGLPILGVLGVMGYLGIRLNAATVIIASVALGLAVDDTIHYLHRFATERTKCADDGEALVRTTAGIGSPMVATSVVLCGGFAMLGLAQFAPTAQFGLLTGATLAFALLGDLVLLPAILARCRPCLLNLPPGPRSVTSSPIEVRS